MNEESIFANAIQHQTPEERAAFLHGACGADDQLRARVEALIRSHEQGGSFLNEPAVREIATVDYKYKIFEKAGARIGRYKLLQEIGEGGFGLVYMAEQTEPVKRKVALKLIKPGMDTREVTARFESERQALALMDHPGVAKVFDAGATESGLPYFVMELVHGVPITELCDELKLSTRERLQLFIDVCHAVQHAHQKGIIHRDLKPSNIMVTMHDDTPVVKVIDFGVSKALNQQLTEKTLFTAYGQMIGTPSYMSPEQAQMSGLDVDTRSDVYSLGILLYELLTGTSPFDKETLKNAGMDELRRMIREVEPPRPSARISTLQAEALSTVCGRRRADPDKLGQSLRGELDWIVMKSMEKDRRKRYDTASGLAADVERHLNNEPVVARRPSTLYRFQKFVRRNTVAVVATVLVVASLVLGVGVSVGLTIRAMRAERAQAHERSKAVAAKTAAETAQGEAEKARNDAVAAGDRERDLRSKADRLQRLAERRERSAKQNLYAAHINLAQRAWNDGHVARTAELLDLHVPAADSDDELRGFEWNYLRRICNLEIMSLGNRESAFYEPNVAFSRDGRRVATCSSDSVLIWDVASGRQTLRIDFEDGERFRCVDFTSDGAQVVAGGHAWVDAKIVGTVRTWNADTGQPMRTFEGHKHEVRSLRISPKGEFTATLGWTKWTRNFGSEVKIWNAATGAEITTLKPGPELSLIRSISFGHSGDRIVTGSSRGLAIWDTASGDLRRKWNSENSVSCAAFSPDGESIASGESDRTIRIWDFKTGRLRRVLPGHKGRVSAIAFDPTGKRIVSGGWDQVVRIWDIDSGAEMITLRGYRREHSNDGISGVGFSPDGWRVASVGRSGMVKIWDSTASREFVGLRGHTDQLTSAVFSPDSTRLASTGLDRTVRIWDVNTKGLLFTLQGHRAWVIAAAFNSKGDRIASVGDQGEVRIWNVRTGQELFSLEGHQGRVSCVAFSPDDRFLATGGAGQEESDNGVRLWDVREKKLRAVFEGHRGAVHGVAFSPDGRRLASASWDHTVRVWDVEARKSLLRYEGHSNAVNDVSFALDGKLLVSASDDRTGKVWDSNTGEDVLTLSGETGSIRGLAVSADQRRAVTVGNSVIVWDLETGQQLLTLPGRSGDWGSVALSPDGMHLAFAASSGKSSQDVILWDATVITPDVASKLDARSVVQTLFKEAASKGSVLAKIRQDQSISDSVRRQALATAENWQQQLKSDE